MDTVDEAAGSWLARFPWLERLRHVDIRVVDVTVAAVACCVQLFFSITLSYAAAGVMALTIIIVASAALLWRRRYPLTVLVVVTCLAIISSLAIRDEIFVGIPPAVALYAVAVEKTTSRAILGIALALGIPTLFGRSVLPSYARLWSSPEAVYVVIIFTIACAAGITVRALRERRESLQALIEQRAERAALTERARITAEMHDVVAHSITVMIALAGGARSAWEKHPERAREALDHLNDVGASALGEMQRILHVMRTEDSELNETLHASGHNVQSLEELIEVFRAAGLPVTLSTRGESEIDDPALRTTIHRIVQEALTNALRYAVGATEVHVDMVVIDSGILVTITDDGHAEPETESLGSGVGLTSIKERAAAFGGSSAFGPRPSGGWRTEVTIPLSERSTA